MKLRTKRIKRSRKHGFGRIGRAYSFMDRWGGGDTQRPIERPFFRLRMPNRRTDHLRGGGTLRGNNGEEGLSCKKYVSKLSLA
ncbi:hypothetical protein H5410_008157 [Solanum commersonii]|uniref:Uncharacterized protein n=1 Tax=Solanum commersonii TaxID=4109 RepID=A0A9J6AEX0_SOLCO|nr:hypothetical protein H5410_008157 [Solanum commersonii]